MKKLTVRLDDERNEKLEQIATRENISKNEVFRRLLDDAGPSTKTLTGIDEKLDLICETLGVDAAGVEDARASTEEKAVTDEEPAGELVPGDGSGVTDATLPTVAGDAVALESLSVSTDVKINPFKGPFDDVVPQTVAKREGVLAACLNSLREQNKEVSREQVENVVKKVFPDYCPQSVSERIDGLIDKGVIYPSPARDPQFFDKRTEIIRKAYGSEYESHAERRDVPTNWADTLPEFWRKKGSDRVYLDTERYVKALVDQLESMSKAYVEYRSVKEEFISKAKGGQKQQVAQKQLYRYSLQIFAGLVEDRLFEVVGPDHGFDGDEYYRGMIKCVSHDVNASKIGALEPYWDSDGGELDVISGIEFEFDDISEEKLRRVKAALDESTAE